MIRQRSLRWWLPLLGGAFSLFLFIGCASDEGTAPQEPVSVDDATEAPAPAPDVTEPPPPPAEGDQVAPTPAPEMPPSAEPTPMMSAGGQKFVTASTLNVRSGASAKATVVRKLRKGEAVNATIEGKWAKIGEGEYVKASFLSDSPGKASKAKAVKAKKAKKAAAPEAAPAAAPAAAPEAAPAPAEQPSGQ